MAKVNGVDYASINILQVAPNLQEQMLLTGQVDTDEQRDLAESVASEVAGVARVVDTISLSFPGA